MTSVTDLLSVIDMTIAYRVAGRLNTAVSNTCFSLGAQETLAIVGESGCGKSTLCRAIMMLLPHNTQMSGAIRFCGRDLYVLEESERRKIRGRSMAFVFQNPSGALNPTRPIGAHLTEAITARQEGSRRELHRIATSILRSLEFEEPDAIMNAFPHQLSGGMQQRAMLAIALVGRPELLISDEPTHSLDILNQALLLQHIADLKSSHGMSHLLVTHDLRIVAQHADRVLVMHKGQIVESGPTNQVLQYPDSPHTKSLIEAARSLSDSAL